LSRKDHKKIQSKQRGYRGKQQGMMIHLKPLVLLLVLRVWLALVQSLNLDKDDLTASIKLRSLSIRLT
jgi:hypothetical protein